MHLVAADPLKLNDSINTLFKNPKLLVVIFHPYHPTD